jgi:hypothetical protein
MVISNGFLNVLPVLIFSKKKSFEGLEKCQKFFENLKNLGELETVTESKNNRKI